MRQKMVLMLALLTFCQVQIFAQVHEFYTVSEIMSKFNKNASSVIGLAMKVTTLRSSGNQWQVAESGYNIAFYKSESPDLNENTEYIIITSLRAITGMSGWYNATGTPTTYSPPPPDLGPSPCNRHYQSAVKFVVDTLVVHPFTINNRNATVVFSTGNLQYCPARDEWRFALRQFDRVGKGKSVYAPEGLKTDGNNINDNGTTVFYDSIDYSTKDNTPSGFKEVKGVPCNNALISKKYGGWVDMFAWGTSGQGRKAQDSLAVFFNPYDLNGVDLGHAANKFGYGPSFNAGHGPGAISNNIDVKSGTNRFFDWGYRNVIREYYNLVYDDNQALVVKSPVGTMYRHGVWRTLTADEWKYLLTDRLVGGEDSAFSYVRLKYGKNTTDTVSGVLIYPDDFSFSEAGVASLPFGATYGVSEIDAATWSALEEVGVVFLPTAYQAYPLATNDNHMNLNDGGLGQMGFYWSSTASDGAQAEYARFDVRNKAVSVEATNRMDFISVRLVQDHTPTPPPPPSFSVSATQKVAFSPGNLQYQGSTKTWRFAPQQYHRCMADNANIANNYDGWIDLFGWGTSGVGNARQPYYSSTTATDYSWSEWGQNVISTYPKNTWRTPTKEECNYLLNRKIAGGDYGFSFVRIQTSDSETEADTVTGVLIYPDDFTWEKAGVEALSVGASSGVQKISLTTWQALEKVGCAFLPGCSYRIGGSTSMQNTAAVFYGIGISYWTSDPSNSDKAYRMEFHTVYKTADVTIDNRHAGLPVRLVRDL